MSHLNEIQKVAIVGATGRVGTYFAKSLLKTGKHIVTALTRSSSTANATTALPSSVHVIPVDYSDPNALTTALRGQQFLVITLSGVVPPAVHTAIVNAAVAAGVPYIMPNFYGFDLDNTKLAQEDLYGAAALKLILEAQSLGAATVGMTCGFWYEHSLALGEYWFGFDVPARKVTFFDDGKTVINVSTWDQCGNALAALLSLPVSGASPVLEDWENKFLYISSFRVCQRDMLDSLHRVLGTSDEDWQITYEPTEKRYRDGRKEMEEGKRVGFAKAMYSRVFFPSGDGDYESVKGVANDVLGLPREDLDTATQRALELIESGYGKSK